MITCACIPVMHTLSPPTVVAEGWKGTVYIKYLRIWPTVCGKAYLLEWTACTITTYTLSLCSCECLLSGLWHHCRHCFGSPCHRHPGPVLHHRLLLLLLCLVSEEDCLQEEEGRCQIHLKRLVATMIKLFWCSRVTRRKYVTPNTSH